MSELSGHMKSLYGSFNQGDIETVVAAMDPNIQWKSADNNIFGHTEPQVGPQAVVSNVFMRLANEVDGFQVNTSEIFDNGESVVVQGNYSGTFKSTGKSLGAEFVHIWKTKDGKLTHFRQYTDTKAWAAANNS